MKKSVLVLATIALVIIAMITSYSSSAQEMEVAQNHIKETYKDSDRDASVNKEYPGDIQKYIDEREDQIAYNEQIIAGYKWQMQNEKEEVKDMYLMTLDDLDRKNNILKKTLGEYEIKGNKKWGLFIIEFNKNMDELALEIRNLNSMNTK